MRRVAVVELRGARSVHPLALDGGRPVTVGRGWHCDVVVDDEFVDAAHLELRRDEAGGLVARDLCTRNGTRLGRRPLTGETPCPDGARLILGETVVALHAADAEVAPAARFDTASRLARRFDAVRWALPATAVGAACLYGEVQLLGAAETKRDLLVETAAGYAALAAIWCAVGATLGKVLRHRALLGLHWTFVALVPAVTLLGGLVAGWLAFNLDSRVADAALEPTLVAGLVALLCYAFLSLSTRLRRPWKGAAALLAGAFPIVFSLVLPALEDERARWSGVAFSGPAGHPPGTLAVAPTTLDDHLERVEGLFAALETEVGHAGRSPTEPPDDEDTSGDEGRLFSSAPD